jgi:CRISPR-associated protein Cas2
MDSDGRRRLRKVAKICQNYGQRVQNSVFECKVDPVQCRQLELKLEDVIDESEDSLRFYYLGKVREPKVKHIGTKQIYDLEKAIII